MSRNKVAVFGVPTAAGARQAGVDRAPFALREAGLLDSLRGLGATVVNLSDLSLFPYRDDAAHPQARNVALEQVSRESGFFGGAFDKPATLGVTAQVNLIEMEPLAGAQSQRDFERGAEGLFQTGHAILAAVHVEEPSVATLFERGR